MVCPSWAVGLGDLPTHAALPGHAFWPDDISQMDARYIDASGLLSSAQFTDSYLLTLAGAHGGQLATFDRELVVDAVLGGLKALCLIQTNRVLRLNNPLPFGPLSVAITRIR